MSRPMQGETSMKPTKATPSKSAAFEGGTPALSTADLLRSEQAYEQLKSDIVACVLSPGEALTALKGWAPAAALTISVMAG